jgi:hypothetical protein
MADVDAIRAVTHKVNPREVMSPTVTVLVAASILFGNNAAAQTPPRSPDDLVRYLTYQSDRPNMHGLVKGESIVFSCGPFLGEARDDRALTNRLVAMGSSAVSSLEEALNSLEANGEKSPVAPKAHWLLLAYANVQGSAASPRLRRMIGKPVLKDCARSLDESVALSLGLTSYVSTFRKLKEHQCKVGDSDAVTLSSGPCKPASSEIPMLNIRCDRGEEPRDALDQLILGVETGDRLLLEWSLGPQARSALRQLPKKTTRAMLIRSGSGSPAVGYRFTVAGRWSEPDENLVQDRPQGNLGGNYINPELETSFTNRAGGSCGRVRIRFSSTPVVPFPNGPRHYSVDYADLAGLMNVIAACANDTSLPR